MTMPHPSRRNRAGALAAAILALAAGCAAPLMPERDNPRDSVGTDFHDPGIELLAGPSNDSVIHESDVSFRWRGTGKADSFDCQLDGGAWQGWSARDSVSYHFLDDGHHTFRLRAKSDHGIVQLTPAQFSFIIDAVTSPALVSIPWHNQTANNTRFTMVLVKKGVSALSQARLVVSYNPAVFRYDTTTAGNCWGGRAVATKNSSPGQVDVTFRLSPVGAGTSGDDVAWMSFIALIPAAENSLAMEPGTHLIGVIGDTIALTTRRGSVYSVVPQ